MSLKQRIKAALGIAEPEPDERPANRAERRAWVKTCGREVRLAYGMGGWLRVPPGRFIPPAGVAGRDRGA